MVRVTEAIFSDGVLKPTEKLDLREKQRVRLVIEPIGPDGQSNRAQALEQFRRGQEETKFRSAGPYPTRDELHERH